jgi:hypothetical protein
MAVPLVTVPAPVVATVVPITPSGLGRGVGRRVVTAVAVAATTTIVVAAAVSASPANLSNVAALAHAREGAEEGAGEEVFGGPEFDELHQHGTARGVGTVGDDLEGARGEGLPHLKR